MKHILIVLALVFAPACSTLGEIMDIPGAVVEDAGGAVAVLTPGDQIVVDTVGTVATTGGTALGGPAAGAALGAIAAGLAAFLLRRRRAATSG
jgi:hypothetical protein